MSNTSAALERLRSHQAQIAIVLGSGLNSVGGNHSEERIVNYSEFSAIPQTSGPGHVGRFVLGGIGRIRAIFAQGRVHLYEGYSAHDVTAIVRVLGEAGISQIILTNAAGTANPGFLPGGWMMISDHINLTGTTPMLGSAQFMDMTETYSPGLREKFRQSARDINMVLYEGVYAGLLGPQYETPAEVRMLQRLGVDAIGMSTVLEVIQARALGLEVAGFSCLTNFAAGLSPQTLNHQEVLETGRAAAESLSRLLARTL